MKNLLFLFLFIAAGYTSAQNGVWVSTNNMDAVTKTAEFQKLNSSFNVTISKAFPTTRNPKLSNVYEISCSCNQEDLYTESSKVPGLYQIELAPNYQTLEVPNDYNTAFVNNWTLDMIEAPAAWDISKGASNTVIAITDANYYLTHEELVNKYAYFTPGNTNTNYAHGTAVAIIAAGNTNNSLGTSSIGYNSTLQLRAMNYNEILNATYAGAKVINCSWAGSCYYNGYAQQVIDEAYNNGSVIVAAAGNGSTCGGAGNMVYPASYDHVISVTSVGISDNHQRFPGDANSTHQHNIAVDICAPGYDVPLTTSPGAYMTGNGTSFAAPLVSGTVALMLSANPCLTPDNIEYILKESADTNVLTLNPTYQGLLGAGRLNARRAVEMANSFNTISGNFKATVECSLAEKSLSVLNLNGSAPYTYEWSTGEITEAITINNDTTYAVIVTDSNGCKFTDNIYIEKYNKLNTNAEIENVKCFGHNDGSVRIVISGGENAEDALWQNGFYGNDLNNLSPGNYSYTIIDGYDCSLTDTITISQPAQLALNMTYENPTNTTNGFIDVLTIGGTMPYSYEWNNGEITEDLQYVTAGFYEMMVSDSNGCLASINIMLETETSTTGLSEAENNLFIAYPNPSNGNVTIKTNIDDDCNLTVTDMNGKTVLFETTFQNTIQLNDLSSGVYTVNVNGQSQRVIIK